VVKKNSRNYFLFLMMSLEKKEIRTHQLTHIMYFLLYPLETQIIHVCMSNHDIKENIWCKNVHICNMRCCLKLFTQWFMQILLQWELLYIFPITWATRCELSILSKRNSRTIDYKYYFHTLLKHNMHDTKVHDSLNICNCMLKYMQIHTNPKCTSSYSHLQIKSVTNLGFWKCKSFNIYNCENNIHDYALSCPNVHVCVTLMI
jgi:hypothetical protein